MYYFILIIGLCLALFNKKSLFFVYGSIISFMAFFRYGVGTDYFAYEYLYSRIQPSIIYEYKSGFDDQEIGFRLISALMKMLGIPYQLYLIVFATLTIFFLVKIVSKYSENPTFSLLIYFSFYYLTWTLSGIRQGLTMTVGIYFLLEYLERKNTKKFIIIVLLLTMIHSSSIVLLFFMFVSKLNLNKKKLISLFIVSIGLSILPLGILMSYLTNLPVVDRILPYMDLNTSLSLSIFDFQSISRIIFIVFAFVFYDRVSGKGVIYKKIMNIYIMSFVLYFSLQFSELAAARLSIYGKILDIIIIVNILYLLRQSKEKMLYVYCVIILCTAYLSKDLTVMKHNFVGGDNMISAPYAHIYNKDNFEFGIDKFQIID